MMLTGYILDQFSGMPFGSVNVSAVVGFVSFCVMLPNLFTKIVYKHCVRPPKSETLSFKPNSHQTRILYILNSVCDKL